MKVNPAACCLDGQICGKMPVVVYEPLVSFIPNAKSSVLCAGLLAKRPVRKSEEWRYRIHFCTVVTSFFGNKQTSYSRTTSEHSSCPSVKPTTFRYLTS